MDYDTSALKCEVVIPSPLQAPKDILSRWSDGNVELPALVVTPETEDDILDAIKLAKEQKFTLLPASGGHGCFVPVTPKTMYLDMKKFNTVALDKASETVRIGGGTSTGRVIKAITAEGYYTLWPNSNAVGYVGCILGGGNGVTNGLHGFMIDAVESIQLITAEGRRLEVSPSSQGEEKSLFNALCGAGHGLGIVTSVVMKAFSISSLKVKDSSFWVRRLILPPTAIDVAATTFARLSDVPPALSVTLVFMRAPPSAPVPGVPMIMLTGTYYGPSEEAEAAVKLLYDDDIVNRAIKAESALVPIGAANDAFEPLNRHGGYKELVSCFLHTVEADTIKSSFEKWVQVGEQYPDAKPTVGIWGRFSTAKLIELGRSPEAPGKFHETRDRGIMANTVLWCSSSETKKALDGYGQQFLATARRNETALARTFPNNQLPGMDLGEMHSPERLAELRRLHTTWDAEHLFWSAY